MNECHIETPLGHAKITRDNNGITSVSTLDLTENISENTPSVLQEGVHQLNAYFEDNLKRFDLKLNPKGTEFQQKVWKALQGIPFGKTLSYLDLSKTTR